MRIEPETVIGALGWALLAIGAALFLVWWRHVADVNIDKVGIGAMVLGLAAQLVPAITRSIRRRRPRPGGRRRPPSASA